MYSSGTRARNEAIRIPWRPLPHMDEFLDELRARNMSRHHIRNRRVSLSHFALFCEREGVNHPLLITRALLIRFQAFTNTNPVWKPSTRETLLKGVRHWISWLLAVGYIKDDPWIAIKIPAVPKQPKPLSEDELSKLFDTHRLSAFNTPPFLWHRREMILACLYGWGLRVHELEALGCADMDVRLDFVSAINKGGGRKDLPYSEEIKKVYQRWVVARAQHSLPGVDALIITRNGRPMCASDLSAQIRELGRLAGVEVNAHRFRDTYGTDLLDADVPVERVMELLGHKSLKQTLAYAKVTHKQRAESHARVMNPRLRQLFRTTGELVTERDRGDSDD